MSEYLSVGFNRSNQPDGAGESLSVSINGFKANISQSREFRGSSDEGMPHWGNLKEIEVHSNETPIDDKVLIELFWEGNTDVAVLANYFAKEGWSLFEVRNNGRYLLFQR